MLSVIRYFAIILVISFIYIYCINNVINFSNATYRVINLRCDHKVVRREANYAVYRCSLSTKQLPYLLTQSLGG